MSRAKKRKDNIYFTTLQDEIMSHCNNYFNPANDPDSPRDYPTTFLDLVDRISEFVEKTKKNNLTGEKTFDYSWTADLEHSSWQKTFAAELAVYKRAKFI